MESSSRLQYRRWHNLPPELWLDIFDWATFTPDNPDVLTHKTPLLSAEALFDLAYHSRSSWTSTRISWNATHISRKLKVRLASVCKAWRMLFIQSIYESITITTFGEIPRLLAILKGSCTGGVVDGHGKWTKQLTWDLEAPGPRISTDSQRDQLGEIINYLPNLESFAPSASLQSVFIPIDVLARCWDAPGIASLTSLRVAGCYELDGLMELFRRATSLTTVELGFYSGTSTVKTFIMPKVQNLSIMLSDFGSRYLECFAGGHYPELRSLSIYIHQGAHRNYDYLNDLLAAVGVTLTFLKVSASSASRVKPYDMSLIAKFCPYLEYLAFDIRSLSNLTFISKLEQLRRISIEINIPITRSQPCGVWDDRVRAAIANLFSSLPSKVELVRIYDLSHDLGRIAATRVWADLCYCKGIKMEVKD